MVTNLVWPDLGRHSTEPAVRVVGQVERRGDMTTIAMYFLVLKLGYGVVVIPDKYTKSQCEAAGKAITGGIWEYVCVSAPT